MQLGWIDFSKSERSRVLSVLDNLSEAGTLDELGISPIRDGFADLFFPGTSTIQTRAKYFFIVPYALIDLEKSQETEPARLLRVLNDLERECAIKLIEHTSDKTGIIGHRTLPYKWVKRAPSEVYWAGLRKYYIFKDRSSLFGYLSKMAAIKKEKNAVARMRRISDSGEEFSSDDIDAGALYAPRFWNVPTYSQDWLNELNMELTSQEASFLKKQIIETCSETMLAFVLKNDITEFLDCKTFASPISSDVELPDLSSIIHHFPDSIQRDYWLAKSFSDFMLVLRTYYNIIVSDKQNEEANRVWAKIQPNIDKYASVDIDVIVKRLTADHLANINPRLHGFLNKARICLQNKDYDALKKCIIEREISLKRASRAKTNHVGEFNTDIWYGGKELEYRFNNTQIIVRDIMNALEDTNA